MTAFNPIKHPRRAQWIAEQHMAQRAKALAPALSSIQAAERMNLTRTEVEQLAARHGFAFQPTKDDY